MSLLSPDNEYEYVDGEYHCQGAAGIDLLYPAPYLCYYDRHDTPSVRAAIDLLKDIIEEDGPYDGVIGFSQGAALVSSLMLCQLLEEPGKPLPFKVAIFLSAGLPLSPSTEIGKDFTLEAQTLERAARLLFSSGLGSDHGSDSDTETSTPGSESPPNVPTLFSKIYSFDPDYFNKATISIPTVHIMGTNDPWVGYSKALIRLCNKDLAKVHFHTGTHEVPRNKASIKDCARLIEGAIGMAQRGVQSI